MVRATVMMKAARTIWHVAWQNEEDEVYNRGFLWQMAHSPNRNSGSFTSANAGRDRRQATCVGLKGRGR